MQIDAGKFAVLAVASLCAAMMVLGPRLARGAEPGVACVPYDAWKAHLEANGWTLLPDIPIDGFAVDRLMIGTRNGHGEAAPVYNDCVLNFSIPLGPVASPAADPTPADDMRKDRATVRGAAPPH